MIPGTFTPHGASSKAPITDLSYRDNHVANDAAGRSSYTHPNLSIGAADPDRWVIVAVQAMSFTTNAFTGCTIGGVAATEIYGFAASGSPNGGAMALYAANVPTGTTVDVAITQSPNAYRQGCGVWTCIAPDGIEFVDGDNANTGDTLSLAVDVENGGVVIAMAKEGSSPTFTFTNATKDFETSLNGVHEFAGGSEAITANESSRDYSIAITASNTQQLGFAVSMR